MPGGMERRAGSWLGGAYDDDAEPLHGRMLGTGLARLASPPPFGVSSAEQPKDNITALQDAVAAIEATLSRQSRSIDAGDTAWMLTCTALVLLMTVPGVRCAGGLGSPNPSTTSPAPAPDCARQTPPAWLHRFGLARVPVPARVWDGE